MGKRDKTQTHDAVEVGQYRITVTAPYNSREFDNSVEEEMTADVLRDSAAGWASLIKQSLESHWRRADWYGTDPGDMLLHVLVEEVGPGWADKVGEA